MADPHPQLLLSEAGQRARGRHQHPHPGHLPCWARHVRAHHRHDTGEAAPPKERRQRQQGDTAHHQRRSRYISQLNQISQEDVLLKMLYFIILLRWAETSGS